MSNEKQFVINAGDIVIQERYEEEVFYFDELELCVEDKYNQTVAYINCRKNFEQSPDEEFWTINDSQHRTFNDWIHRQNIVEGDDVYEALEVRANGARLVIKDKVGKGRCFSKNNRVQKALNTIQQYNCAYRRKHTCRY